MFLRASVCPFLKKIDVRGCRQEESTWHRAGPSSLLPHPCIFWGHLLGSPFGVSHDPLILPLIISARAAR